MGHSKLNGLPKTRTWQKVVEPLASSDASLNEIIALTAQASRKTLIDSRYAESLNHCYWLFTNLAKASRGNDFAGELQNLGINISKQDSGIGALKKIYDSASTHLRKSNNISILDEIAVDAFKGAIHNTIAQESQSLFGCNLETIQKAFKKYSTSKWVSKLGRDFFSEYVYKSFSHVLEKELANSIRPNGRFQNSADISEFDKNLEPV
jgi:hypothetical protein